MVRQNSDRRSIATIEPGDGLEQFLAMAETQAEFLELAFVDQRQRIEIDAVLGKDRFKVLQAKVAQPTR